MISGDERLAKPDPRIFDVLLERYGLAAAETLFIDDHAPNVEAAAALGFAALRFVAATDIRAELERLGLLAANRAGASVNAGLTASPSSPTAIASLITVVNVSGSARWCSRDRSRCELWSLDEREENDGSSLP